MSEHARSQISVPGSGPGQKTLLQRGWVRAAGAPQLSLPERTAQLPQVAIRAGRDSKQEGPIRVGAPLYLECSSF